MPDLTLRPAASSSSSSSAKSKPHPTASLLKPWNFTYYPSTNGPDLNLLIMFHGLGDTKTPFSNLGKQLNLPCTAILSLQAPDPLPLLETPSWSWYNTFTPLFEPLPNPNPNTAIPALRNLLQQLISPEVGWRLRDIHLFGWGQGGTMALEFAYHLGRNPLPEGRVGRLGSTISICSGLISHPSTILDLETPVCLFTRLNPSSAAGQKLVGPVHRGFKKVEVVWGKTGRGEDMPRGKEEWAGVMKFWGEVLGREEGWKGGGEAYEVVR